MNKNRLKFRAWDKLAEQFVYPDQGYQGHYILTLNGQFQNLQNGSGGDEYIVQQWTGEFDKNNQEIYEGDVIRATSEQYINENFVARVIFAEASFLTKINDGDVRGVWGGEDIEVIGNIFQPPCTPTPNEDCQVCDDWVIDCTFTENKEDQFSLKDLNWLEAEQTHYRDTPEKFNNIQKVIDRIKNEN